MKRSWTIIALALLWCIHSTGISAQQPVSISITEIVEDEYIAGNVRGLSPTEYGRYKVIVYVHTDQWYIHPYAGQDEGQSWAAIQKDGSWKLQTVKRQFSADRMMALVVGRNYPEPSKADGLMEIQSIARTTKVLIGGPDHRKL